MLTVTKYFLMALLINCRRLVGFQSFIAGRTSLEPVIQNDPVFFVPNPPSSSVITDPHGPTKEYPLRGYIIRVYARGRFMSGLIWLGHGVNGVYVIVFLTLGSSGSYIDKGWCRMYISSGHKTNGGTEWKQQSMYHSPMKNQSM